MIARSATLLHKESPRDYEAPSSPERAPVADLRHLLEPSYYLGVLKRRAAAFVVPFLLVLMVAIPIIATRPAVYLVEGKILVDAPQISSDLVRPTVAALANERIQLIEQRIMTRDNLLAIADKFNVFGAAHDLSVNTVVSLMRLRTQIKLTEDILPTRPYDRQPIAFTVAFEHEQPNIALQVTNELITLILTEDIRARTDSASETTHFLENETARIEGEVTALETQIAERRQRNADRSARAPQPAESQLAELKAELAQKGTIYSASHPDMKALKQKIAALEATVVVPTKEGDAEPDLDALERQEASLQKILEQANQKLATARLGESLERGQRFDRLEVIEPPTLPNTPVRPNRLKLLAAALAAAVAAGGGLVSLMELRDDTIRRVPEVLRLVDPQLVIGIPLIATKAEARRGRRRVVLLMTAIFLLALAGAWAASQLPVDRLLPAARAALQTS